MASAMLRSCAVPAVQARLAVRCQTRQQVSTDAVAPKAVSAISSLKHHLSVLAVNAAVVLPALAEEEKGAIFDFNLTLPLIAAQFLFLMVALDNIWFKPVSKVMDARDEDIRKMLISVRDNSSEIKGIQDEADAMIRAARAQTANALTTMKKETAVELDAKLQKARENVEAELASALANLEKQKEETLKSLDAQVTALSNDIVRKVVPFKI